MKKKNKNLQIFNWHIILPIGTVLMVALLFFWVTSYKPSWNFDWTGIRTEIRDSVQLIEKYGGVTSKFVGYAGKTPQQWHRKKWLIKNANENELIKLLEYPNGAVKAIAYEALLKKSTLNKYNLINQALTDTTSFFIYQSGCYGDMMMLGEYILENVVYLPSDKIPPPPTGALENLELTQKEIKELTNLYEQRKEKKWEYLKRNYAGRK